MTKFFGDFAKIQELENELAEVENLISETYDFWDEDSVPVELSEKADDLEAELTTLKRNRCRGGLVCRCM